jgi:protein SCO1
MNLAELPLVNALLNTLSAILLIIGFRFIKQKRISQHKIVMITAFVISIIFLCCYLLHKYHLYTTTGTFNTMFKGEGIWRTVYFSILITHLIFAIMVPFLAIITLFRGLKMKIETHKKIAKITLPIWMYVSVTGVLVYIMLYKLFP